MKDNDRKHMRLKVDAKVFIELAAAPAGSEKKGELVRCEVIDVSYGGFKVLLPSEVIIGTILSVCAELPYVDEPFFMVAEVKWIEEAPDDNAWYAGFELLRSRDSDIESWWNLLEHI